jgi:hypothetical protein
MLSSLNTPISFVRTKRKAVCSIVIKITYHRTCGINLCQPVTGQYILVLITWHLFMCTTSVRKLKATVYMTACDSGLGYVSTMINYMVFLSMVPSVSVSCSYLLAFFPHIRNGGVMVYLRQCADRLCDLVRVSGYRSRGPGFDSRRYQIF